MTEPDDGRLADAVDRILRADGRSPAVDVAACLSLEERALHRVLGDASVRRGAAPPDATGPMCHLAVHEYGRAYVSLARPEGRDLHARGWTRVSPAELDAVARARAELDAVAREADSEVDALLDGLSSDAFTALVHHVADAVDHNDPVQLFVDDALFTNVDRLNNLLPKPGNPPEDRYVLCRLAHGTAADLSRAERRFFGVFFLLREAGLRAEELNGRQFTPWAVSTFFDQKYRQYARALEGASEPIEPWPSGIADRAACLGRLKRRLAGTHRVYRWIDAVTLRKEERWRARDEQPRGRDLPPAITRHCVERYGLTPDGDAHHDGFFLDVIRRIARIEDAPSRSQAYEELLEVVVRSAMQAVPSPIGMTRGMRDLRHFQDAIEEGRFADVCATPLDDGFCAVFAREDAHLYDQPLGKVLRAISRRMQFNHRHYLPGHFDAEAVPDRPHFYYPPTMSDIAENGEHRHTGHTMARVRHSIRSPAPLRVAGRSWPGLVDIRMMRAVGHPYTEADLVVVDRHTEYVRSIAQAVLALKTEGLPAPIFGDRAQYEKRYPHGGSVPEATATRPAGPTIGAMLRGAIERHADAVAITCAVSGRTFTFSDLRAVAERLVAATGGRPGARVAVVCGDRTHQSLAIAAGLLAGLVVCPLDHAMPARALEGLMRHAAPDSVLTDAAAKPLPGAPRDLLRVESLLGASDAAPGALPDAGAGGLLIYTSGATGLPKGVLLDEQQIGANVAFAREHFGYGASEGPWTSGCLLPLHHTFAIASDLLPVLCAGGRVVILPGFTTDDAGAVADALGRHQVRSFSAVPIVLEALLALSVPLPSSLAFAISGAAPLLERSRQRYRERHGHPVIPCYGLTESVCFATASPLDGVRPGSAGRPAGISIRIVGEDLLPVRPGEQGEIALRGSSVVSRYFTRGEPSGSEPIVDAPDPCCEEGWFLTGDMGRIDEDGYLFITGRRKNMLIRGGEKLYLEDLDRCLEEHPAVAEACSVQVAGLFGFERAVTFLVGRGAMSASQEDEAIRAHVRDRLGPVGVPDELRWTDRIPRSATGKPLRDALRGRCKGAA